MGFWYISGRCGKRNQDVEHNVTAFSELSFAVHMKCYAEASTMSNSTKSNVKLITIATMVDNLAEKFNKCQLNWGR